MGTLQNPSPNSHPQRCPLPNANNGSNPSPNATAAPGLKSPTFEEVSNLFSLPLSDAADFLGVCPSVLKKVCYDNGLVRWPYRKFLAGKSIEEIKKDTAIEKGKQLVESTNSGQRASLASSAVSTSLTSQPQITNSGTLQQTRMLTLQPTRDNQTESLHNMHMSKGSTPTSDEFKYGFPSDGLLSISYRWWGNKTSTTENADDDNKSSSENGVDSKKSSTGDAEERNEQPNNHADTAANLSSMEVGEGKKDERGADIQWASSLSALRKKAAEDGHQSLKLGVYKGYNVKTLNGTKKMVLFQIFKSALPDEWGDMSSES